MEPHVGDRLTDETAEWEIIGRSAVHDEHWEGRACPRAPRRQPDVTDMRMWSAHERITVKRASAEEDKG
jgi:hypothetical protein